MISRNFKNVLVVSTGFLSLFTAYGGLQSLQSSLNAAQGMGVASLSVIYAGIIISSMFLPPIMIKNLGCKWTIVVGMVCYVSYSFGNLYPGWYTLIPTSFILGLGGSPLWSAKCTYLTISGNMQAAKDNKKGADVVNHYFGIFFFIFQSSAVWGNLMSSLIFGQDTNISDIPEDVLSTCGAFDCGLSINTSSSNSTSSRPAQRLVWTLLGCYIGNFTNYVTCALGIHFVGYVMMCFGAANSLCSFLFGRIARYTGRAALFFFAGATNLACIITLLLWRPHPDQLPVFFVLPALWGMADAIWQTQTNALYGILFPRDKEAAFANYRMWESLGFVIAFAYSTFLCLEYKLYIVLAVLVITMITYPIVEYYEYRNPTQPIEQAIYENPKNKAEEAGIVSQTWM
ncbi:protein unc-93 homolog A [Gambusia affinis]|uniref:protein unc-93 homolog A n=1 Tax=Gambusia affinis TaxID=33528 RepID=UPI001CDBD607|nr:protein unc-93 homolog A [Gambusia affinis]